MNQPPNAPTKLQVLNESLTLVYKALNKANGSFTLDESHVIHLAMHNLKQHLEELEKGESQKCKTNPIPDESKVIEV